MENRKINAETNSHGDKLSTRTNAFHQLFHQRQQPQNFQVDLDIVDAILNHFGNGNQLLMSVPEAYLCEENARWPASSTV